MRHLIFPASFFPSIGGAQGSLLNFLHCFSVTDQVCLALGGRGFLFSVLKKRRFLLAPPYLGILIHNVTILRVYLMLLARFWKPDIIWLYGGGMMAARVLDNRDVFPSNLKIVVRSMGSDIQYDELSGYGYKPSSKEFGYIVSQYPKADFLWALSEEIETIYKDNIRNFSGKIVRCGNSIWKPEASLRVPTFGKIKIGVIGRNHPKKNFDLLNDILKVLDPKIYDVHLKTPGFNLKKYYENVFYDEKTKIIDLLYWPPRDVWEFYDKVDILLVLSRVESFGNITFEAGLAGCAIVMHEKTTGATLAKKNNFSVHTYTEFCPIKITATVSKVTFPKYNSSRLSLNSSELKELIKEVVDE